MFYETLAMVQCGSESFSWGNFKPLTTHGPTRMMYEFWTESSGCDVGLPLLTRNCRCLHSGIQVVLTSNHDESGKKKNQCQVIRDWFHKCEGFSDHHRSLFLAQAPDFVVSVFLLDNCRQAIRDQELIFCAKAARTGLCMRRADHTVGSGSDCYGSCELPSDVGGVIVQKYLFSNSRHTSCFGVQTMVKLLFAFPQEVKVFALPQSPKLVATCLG
ncbi:unnamed protein product [Toxocara canis]|uniref:Uncharacterized protein n=1 Tax=Toxocara canis TaxID=6265 RepID=A0A183UX87_TOXCA|nr:unnamed protein product [Toxocara canis]